MSRFRRALRDLPDAVFVDALESDDAYRFVIDLPGVTSEGLDLHSTDGRLSIEGRREAPGEEFRYVQEGRDDVLRAEIPLPPDATADDAEASMDRGVLEVTVPKRGSGVEVDVPVEDA